MAGEAGPAAARVQPLLSAETTGMPAVCHLVLFHPQAFIPAFGPRHIADLDGASDPYKQGPGAGRAQEKIHGAGRQRDRSLGEF